jgi:Matrixin
MKKSLILLPFFFLTACNTKSVDPVSSSGNINVEAPYLWASTAFPRNLRISNEFSANEVSNIQSMALAWETAVESKKDFFNVNDRTPEVSAPDMDLDGLGEDGVNGVYKIRNWPKGLNSGALAVTQIFGRRYNVGSSNEYVRIEHADVLINENLYDFRTDDTATGWSYDLRTVVLHELGHFLGLGHKYGATVMIPSIGSNTVNRAPTSLDITDISTKYGVSVTTGATNAIVAGPSVNYIPNKNDPGQMVKILIEFTAEGECVHKENDVVLGRHFLGK